MAKLVDVIQYEGDNSTFVWKHDSTDFNTMTQLIVHESQEAVLFRDGQALDLFPAGRYTLQSQNIPLLRKIVNLPTGGTSPFHCEVYFVNKVEQMAIKWGTDSKVQYIEPDYGFPISIGASGDMSLRVEDSRRLLVKLVGTERDLSQQKLVGYFRGILMANVKTYIAQVMRENHINIFQIDELLVDFSKTLQNRLGPDFLDYGVSLERFNVTTIVKPEGDREFERFKKIFFEESIGLREERLAQQREFIRQQTEAQGIVTKSAAIAQKRKQEGYTYQQERGFDVAETVGANEGIGNFTSAGIGLGMMGGIGSGMGSAVANLTSQAMAPIAGVFSTGEPAEPTSAGVGMVTPPPTIELKRDDAPPAGPSGEPTDPMVVFKQKLEQLKMMKEAGLLSDDELAEAKKKLMDQIVG